MSFWRECPYILHIQSWNWNGWTLVEHWYQMVSVSCIRNSWAPLAGSIWNTKARATVNVTGRAVRHLRHHMTSLIHFPKSNQDRSSLNMQQENSIMTFSFSMNFYRIRSSHGSISNNFACQGHCGGSRHDLRGGPRGAGPATRPTGPSAGAVLTRGLRDAKAGAAIHLPCHGKGRWFGTSATKKWWLYKLGYFFFNKTELGTVDDLWEWMSRCRINAFFGAQIPDLGGWIDIFPAKWYWMYWSFNMTLGDYYDLCRKGLANSFPRWNWIRIQGNVRCICANPANRLEVDWEYKIVLE